MLCEKEFIQTKYFKDNYSVKLEFLSKHLTPEQLEQFNSKSFYQKLYYVDNLSHRGWFERQASNDDTKCWWDK